MMTNPSNLDRATVESFGEQWSRFDQASAGEEELRQQFQEYFRIFPWERLPQDATGADIGCGSGRWARFVAPRVETLHCVDASETALRVAERNLGHISNVRLHRASVDALPFEDGSLDFAYSLGVLHHVPETKSAIASCARVLKEGAPFLVYLYYAFDNRPVWFRTVWRASNWIRGRISKLPSVAKDVACDFAALMVYWPLARSALVLQKLGVDVTNFPLAMYRDRRFYTMRTDARDRFGTPVEHRFTADEVTAMMNEAGFGGVRISDSPPYWCAVAFKV